MSDENTVSKLSGICRYIASGINNIINIGVQNILLGKGKTKDILDNIAKNWSMIEK